MLEWRGTSRGRIKKLINKVWKNEGEIRNNDFESSKKKDASWDSAIKERIL